MDERGIWFGDQNVILHIFSDEFCRRFKNDHNIDRSQAISLSYDITTLDNERRTCMAANEEIT